MGNYADYYKDIENSIPMKSADNLTKQRQNYFAGFLAKRKFDRICEYGCGPGTNVKYLLRHCNNLDCFDIEESLREYVIPPVGNSRVEYALLTENGETTGKPDNTYDGIYSTDVLEHIYWPRVAVKEMYRILKNEGEAFITVPYHGLLKNLAITFLSFDKHYSPDDPHVRFFTTKTLINLFVSEGFTVEHIGYLGRIRGFSKNICAVFRKK